MYERFTDRARRVIILAQEEARLLNHNYIGSEHVLLGLIHEGESAAAKALESLGITLENVRLKVEEIIGQGVSSPRGHIPFTPRAAKILELALRESLNLGHNYLGPEHVLLGLVREVERESEAVAGQILGKLGVELATIRPRVMEAIAGTLPGTTPAETEPPLPGREVVEAVTTQLLADLGRLRSHILAGQESLKALQAIADREIKPDPDAVAQALAWWRGLARPDRHPTAALMRIIEASVQQD